MVGSSAVSPRTLTRKLVSLWEANAASLCDRYMKVDADDVLGRKIAKHPHAACALVHHAWKRDRPSGIDGGLSLPRDPAVAEQVLVTYHGRRLASVLLKHLGFHDTDLLDVVVGAFLDDPQAFNRDAIEQDLVYAALRWCRDESTRSPAIHALERLVDAGRDHDGIAADVLAYFGKRPARRRPMTDVSAWIHRHEARARPLPADTRQRAAEDQIEQLAKDLDAALVTREKTARVRGSAPPTRNHEA